MVISLNTAAILIVISILLTLLVRAVAWLLWNLELVSSRRQITMFRLAGLGLVLVFLCPGIAVLLINVLQMVGLVTLNASP